jgi:hypothetical protein
MHIYVVKFEVFTEVIMKNAVPEEGFIYRYVVPNLYTTIIVLYCVHNVGILKSTLGSVSKARVKKELRTVKKCSLQKCYHIFIHFKKGVETDKDKATSLARTLSMNIQNETKLIKLKQR